MIRVIYGAAGQTIRHVVPATVASATYAILDLGKSQASADRILSSGAATVPSWGPLTLDAGAGPDESNSRLIPVTLTAGPAIGDTIFLISSSGAYEALDVEGINSNDTLEVRSHIARSYVTGDTVGPAVISAAVTTALYNFEDALDDQRALAIQWTYTVGADERVATDQIMLTRTNGPSTRSGAALALVRTGFPDLPERLTTGQSLEALAEYCAKSIDAELAMRGEFPDRMLLGDPGDWLLHDKIMFECAVRGYSPGTRDLSRFVDEAEARYDRRLEALVIGTAGTETTTFDTETVASHTPDTAQRSPIGPM